MNKKHILRIDNRDEVNGKKSILNLQNVRKVYSKEGVDFLLANLAGNLPVSSYTDNGDGTYTLSDGNGGTPTVLDTNADSSFIGANITIGATTFVAGTNTVQEVLEALVDAIEIRDRIVDPNVSGTYNLDHDLATDWKLTLTGATTLADINFPPKTMEFTLKITGDFPLSVPSYWDMNGETYDGTGWNFFAIQLHDSTPSSEEVTVFLTNIV